MTCSAFVLKYFLKPLSAFHSWCLIPLGKSFLIPCSHRPRSLSLSWPLLGFKIPDSGTLIFWDFLMKDDITQSGSILHGHIALADNDSDTKVFKNKGINVQTDTNQSACELPIPICFLSVTTYVLSLVNLIKY